MVSSEAVLKPKPLESYSSQEKRSESVERGNIKKFDSLGKLSMSSLNVLNSAKSNHTSIQMGATEEEDIFPMNIDNSSTNTNKRPVIKLDLSSIIRPGGLQLGMSVLDENSRVTQNSNQGEKSTKKIPLSATSSQNMNSNSRFPTRVSSCAQSSAHYSSGGPLISNSSSCNNSSLRNTFKSPILAGFKSVKEGSSKLETCENTDLPAGEFVQSLMNEISMLREVKNKA